MGTGNYHPGTARSYTDIGLMSADADLGNDVHLVFQQLSGLSTAARLKHLLQSPFTLHAGLLKLIDREAQNAREGRPAGIQAKMNALNEPAVIRALYEASIAGVKVELIVRGACGLRPGVAGVSDNIRVVSVVGRFLEHSRVYCFLNAGKRQVYCSSADWMERNLLRRVETCFPILDPELAERVYDEEIGNYLADNTHAWELSADGSYRRLMPEGDAMPHSAQHALLTRLCSA